MTLKYNPYTELAETRARLDRLFGRDNFWETIDAPAAGDWVPAIDIVESDGVIAIKAELPGVEPNDVAVTVDGNVLTLTGEHMKAKCGTFGRSFVLPSHVDALNIKAELRDGLLTLTLPKNGAGETRAIAVAAK